MRLTAVFLVLLVLDGCLPQERPAAGGSATPPAATPASRGPATETLSFDTVPASTPAAATVSPAAATAPPTDSAYQTDSAGRIRFPLVIRNACEGEDCQTEYAAVACEEVELRAMASDSARIVGHVARGDTVSVTSSDLHVARPGVVVLKRDFVLTDDDQDGLTARRDTLHFARGDTVFVIRYYELGLWQWWHRGRVSNGSQFWVGPPGRGPGLVTSSRDTLKATAIAYSRPEREQWVRVTPRAGGGEPGWWRYGSDGWLGDVLMMQHWDESCAGMKRPAR